MNGTSSREYLTCAETAAMVRASIKRNFPGTKFSVRSKTYSGGASARVTWTNGPTVEQVQRVTVRFEGADFDGMQDLKTSKTQLLADEGGNVREVRHGADFIFTDRTHSPEVLEACRAAFAAKWDREQWDRMPSYDQDNIAYRGLVLIAIPAGEPATVTAERAVASYFATPTR